MRSFRLSASLILSISLSGCGIPQFDIPVDESGAPTVRSIVRRITCELVALVRDGPGEYDHKTSLLAGNYQVAVNLSLDVSDTGELTPSFNFPIDSTLSLNAGFKFGKKRTHNFSEKLLFSLNELREEWKREPSIAECPVANTNLAGELGIKDYVTMALNSQGLNTAVTLAQAGAFGGSIEFVVTRNVNSLGATWTLTSFRGPGNLALLQRVNTDKVTFSFAAGPPTEEGTVRATQRAEDYLNQLLLDQLRFR